MANDYIKVSRRQARRILELYTLQGYTQQEIGEVVFSPSVEQEVSRGLLTRRVLHQLGLNMQSRSNYADTGLTPRIIDAILSNPRLIFPLVVPYKGDLHAYISFDKELHDQLTGTGRASKARGYALNILALIIIAALQYLATNYYDHPLVFFLPLIGVFLVSLALSALDEEYHSKEKGKALFGFVVILVICYAVYRAAMAA